VRGPSFAGVAAVAVAIVAAAVAALPGFAAGATLNRPGHLSHWAFVERPTPARLAPSASSRSVGRLGLRTQDGTDELVLALEDRTDPSGREWVRVRLPERPNGATGWVPRDTLGELNAVDTWLKIDRAALRLSLVRDGKVIFRAPIGVGTKANPTPPGEFYVRHRLIGFAPGSAYGAMAFGLNAYAPGLTDWPRGGVVGIHGTNRPELLPGRVSHGCIRLYDADILTLDRLMPVGTPVTVR
jgi:hypothetical protein